MFELQNGGIGKVNLKAINIANEWKNWKDQFKMFLRATNLEAEKDGRKVALLLHHMGPECIHIGNSFNVDYDTVKYEDLIKRFDEYFVPKLNIAMERHKFFTRKQKEDETLESYVTVLKNMSLICGMSPKLQHIKERLLSEGKIELGKAVEIFRNIEAARENASQLLQSSSSNQISVNVLNKKIKNTNICNKCGQTHKSRCPAYESICHACGRKGHYAKMCFFKQKQQQQKHEV